MEEESFKFIGFGEPKKRKFEAFHDKIFEAKGNSIYAWLMSIMSLLSASKLIDNQAKKLKNEKLSSFMTSKRNLPISFWAASSGFMLKGYALECFLKAIWLSMGNTLVENGKYIGIPDVNQHDLLKLTRKLDLHIFSESEERFINTLTKYSTAYGRYPIPTKPDLVDEYIPDNYFEEFEEIIKKLANEITKYSAYDKKTDTIFLNGIIGLVSK